MMSFNKSYGLAQNKTIEIQKIACFKSNEIIQNLPEFIKAEKKLKNISIQYDRKFNKIIENFQKKAEKYQKEANLKSVKENKKRTLELIQIKKQAEQYQIKATQEINNKQNNILNPIYKKIENAILQVINKDKSIKRVDDCSPGKGVIINRGLDITNDVLKILGIKKKINKS